MKTIIVQQVPNSDYWVILYKGYRSGRLTFSELVEMFIQFTHPKLSEYSLPYKMHPVSAGTPGEEALDGN